MESYCDLETDARGESVLEAFSHPDTISTRSQYSMSDNDSGIASLSSIDSLQASGSSDEFAAQFEYLEYINFMPLELRYDYFEILIICVQSDEEEAETFKIYLEDLGYRVQILEIGTLPSFKVELAYQKAMFFFLYVTKEFCKNTTAVYHSHVFLSETLNDDTKKWNVVPVYTTMDRNEIKLDILLRNLHPIKYHRKDKDVNTIKKFLNGKGREIAERELNLHLERQTYFNANKCELYSLKGFSRQACFSNLLHNRKENSQMKLPTTECTSCDTLVKRNVGIDDISIKSNSNYDPTKKARTENEITDLLGVQWKSKHDVGGIYNEVQIDRPLSQNMKSPTMTTSSGSKFPPSINPNAQTEILHQAESGKHETHVHYHNNINVENVTNLLIGDGGSISTQHGQDKDSPKGDDLDVLQINRETSMNCNRLNSGSVYHRSKPNVTDFNPDTGKVYIGVFWDVQNCPVPRDKSAADIIKLIRTKFIFVDANNEEKCFYCITDTTREDVKTLQAISKSGIDLLHISSDEDNSSDLKIIQKMEDFSRDIGAARAKVILITIGK